MRAGPRKRRSKASVKVKHVDPTFCAHLVEDQRAQDLHLVLFFAREKVAQTREQNILVELGNGATARVKALQREGGEAEGRRRQTEREDTTMDSANREYEVQT